MNKLSIEAILEHRLRSLTKIIPRQKRKLNTLSLLRIVSFLAIPLHLALLYIGHVSGWYYLTIFISLAIFIYLVQRFRHQNHYLFKLKKYRAVLQRETHRNQNNLAQLFRGDPEIQTGENHYYRDLDLFGEYGLFSYLDTTETKSGEKLFLDQLLRQENTREQILQRQQLIGKLAENRFLSLKALRLLQEGKDRLYKMDTEVIRAKHRSFLHELPALAKLFPLMPVLLWSSLVLSVLFSLPSVASGLFFGQLLLHIYYRRKALHFFKPYRVFAENYFQILKLIQYLQKVQFLQEESSESIQPMASGFEKIAARLAYIEAPAFHVLLNALFLWDFWLIRQIEKWHDKYISSLDFYLQKLAYFDSLLPFVVFKWHHRHYEFPQILLDGEGKMSADKIGHPLLAQNTRVDNPLPQQTNGDILLLTGSNMSGKTTYLRTIGVNVLLANCGSALPVKNFFLPPLRILTSIKNFDSLKDGISFFYSEVKQISYVLKRARQEGPALILLDEILKGTNTRERFIASEAILKQIHQTNSFCMVTTHDLELTKIEPNDYLKCYHFSEQIEDGEMSFDFKLKQGVVDTSNALFILKKEGVDC